MIEKRKRSALIYKIHLSWFAFLVMTYSCNQQPFSNKLSYKDPDLSAGKRAELLLSQMTLEEKIAQVCSQSIRDETGIEEGFSSADQDILSFIKNGIGQLDNTFDNRTPVESAVLVNRLQQFLLDSTRLQIPALIGSECLHGHAGYQSTIFPTPIAMACTWDTELINRVYDIIGREARLRGSTEAHTPVLDVGRDPRWGRIEETYGEDTYLVTQLGLAAISGLQGGSSGEPGTTHIISSAKHFAGYGQVVGGRNFAPTAISTRTLYDEILPPFELAVKEANVLGIMASHCDIDGIPAHGNKWLLTTLLKEEWGFEGMVVSDYMDIQRLFVFHHVAEDLKDAAEIALEAGMDLDLPVGYTYRHLKEVIQTYPYLEKHLDESVRRILQLKFKLGLFENPFVDLDACKNFVGSDANIALSEKIATEAIVLLKNENRILPLAKENTKSIAVIGPNATSIETGVYSVKSDRVISILEGIRQEVKDKGKVYYAKGCEIALFQEEEYSNTEMRILPLNEEIESIREAVNLAKKSDVAVVCVGGATWTSREAIYLKEHKGDRNTLNLLGNQEELIRQIHNTGKPVILVLMGGKPYALSNVEPYCDAIISTFYLGEQTGTAVSNILFGKANPSGKIPISFPRSVGQLPVYYSQKATAFYKDYLEGTSRPLYPFGFGLSYSTFNMDGFQSEKDSIQTNEPFRFSINVKNAGAMAGSEVIQVYFSDLTASVTRPEKLLVRFKKVQLEPGESKLISFELIPEKDFAFTGIDYQKRVEPGIFRILVGNSSGNIMINKELRVLPVR
jgi:beta-glucosidase